jgi:hypothetical protein
MKKVTVLFLLLFFSSFLFAESDENEIERIATDIIDKNYEKLKISKANFDNTFLNILRTDYKNEYGNLKENRIKMKLQLQQINK